MISKMMQFLTSLFSTDGGNYFVVLNETKDVKNLEVVYYNHSTKESATSSLSYDGTSLSNLQKSVLFEGGRLYVPYVDREVKSIIGDR